MANEKFGFHHIRVWQFKVFTLFCYEWDHPSFCHYPTEILVASHHLIFATSKTLGKSSLWKSMVIEELIKNSCWLIGATWTLFAFVCDVWDPVYSATNWATLRTLLICSLFTHYRKPMKNYIFSSKTLIWRFKVSSDL